MQKRSEAAQRLPGQDHRYDGKHVLVFDHAALRSGDVVLTMNATAASTIDRAKAKVIARTTGGTFSHALMCTTPPTLIEAISEGVSNISTLRCFVHHPDHLRVLRYTDPQIAAKAGTIAAAAIGKPYATVAALLSIAPIEADQHQSKVFCSALVAASFKRAGAPELSDINPNKVTPIGLAGFGLEDVTHVVMRAILAPQNVEELSALDGDRTSSPMSGQAALMNDAFEKIRPSLNAFWNKHYLPGTSQITSFMDCLNLVEGGLRFARGNAANDGVEALAVDLRRLDAAILSAIPSERFLEMMRATILLDSDSLRRIVAESFKSDPDIDVAHVVGMLETSRRQYAMRFANHNVLSSALTEWLRIQWSDEAYRREKIAALEGVCRRLGVRIEQ